MFPHTITVWNRIASNHTGGFTYQRTIINNVRYERTIAKQSTKEGETNASNLLLFVFPTEIECNDTYIESTAFKELVAKTGYYTFCTDTIIGIGEILTDSPSGETYSINSIKPIYAQGSEIHHFELIGS